MCVKFILLVAFTALVTVVSSRDTDEPTRNGIFAADIFKEIVSSKSTENVIISPVSIQSALAMVFLGAKGKTAKELEQGLRLSSSNKDIVGQNFKNLLQQKSGEAELNIANRVYANIGYTVDKKFNEEAEKYFNSEVETINFAQNTQAAKTINSWIGKKTNDKIQNVLSPDSVNADTSAIIVNAIYFKGKWESPFSKDATSKQTFWISRTKSIETPTMYADEHFNYAVLPELNATAIEMPYMGSNISMLVILPNERDGLAELEHQLQKVDLNELSSRMTSTKLQVYFPLFKIEFSIELTGVLKALGIRTLFENSAELSGIFESGPPVKVSDVTHKAYIEVNEAGSEATAATLIRIVSLSLILSPKTFRADHPFVFAIKSPEAVYFVGHLASL